MSEAAAGRPSVIRPLLQRLRGLATRRPLVAMADQVLLSALSLALSLALLLWATKAEYALYAQLMNLASLAGPLHVGLFLSAATPVVAGAAQEARPGLRSALARAMLVHAVIAIPIAVVALLVGGPMFGLNQSGMAIGFAALLVGQWLREFVRMQAYAVERPAEALAVDVAYTVVIGALIGGLVLTGAVTAAFALVAVCAASLVACAVPFVRLAAAPVAPGMLAAVFARTWALGRWDAAGSIVTWVSSQSYLVVASISRGIEGVADIAATRLVAVPLAVLVAGHANVLVAGCARSLRDRDLPRVVRLVRRSALAFLLVATLYFGVVALAYPLVEARILPATFAGLQDLALLWIVYGALTGLTTMGASVLKASMHFDRLFRCYLLAAPVYIGATLAALWIDPRTAPILGLIAGETVCLAIVTWTAWRVLRFGRAAGPASGDDAAPVIVATLLRETGSTGVQTHFNAFRAVLRAANVPERIVTPFYQPAALVVPFLAARRVLERVSPPAAVWWYRHWHFRLLRAGLREVLRQHPGAVVYAQCPLAARAALEARASPRQQVALVVHFNESQADEWADKGRIARDGRLFRRIRALEATVLPAVDRLVFVSAYMRDALLARIPAARGVPAMVIPNFVTDDAAADRHPETAADLVAIGTLEPRKNQAYLLHVLAAAEAFGRRYTLTLVGDGPDRAALEALASRLGVADRVRFAGYEAAAARRIAGHALLVHASRMESFGIVLVEAFARGVPVIAAPVGGIPEVFTDRVEGRHWPLDDAGAAAEVLIEAMDDHAWRSTAGAHARERFLTRFEAGAVGARLLDFLRPVMPVTAPQADLRVAWLANTIPTYRVPDLRLVVERLPGVTFVINDDPPGLNLAGAAASALPRVIVTDAWWFRRRRRHPGGYLSEEHFCVPHALPAQLRRLAPEVVIAGELGLRAALALAWRALHGRARVIVHADLSEATERGYGRLRTAFRRYVLGSADRVVVNGASGARYVARLGVPPGRIVEIPYSADVEQFTPAGTVRDAAAPRRLLFVGQLIERKGILPFLDALHDACAAAPDAAVELVIVGAGPLGAAVAAHPVANRVNLRVQPPLPRDMLPALYRTADVLVLPSLAESWALVVGEALAAGVPVLGSVHAQAVDALVRDGENGWRFDPGDAAAMRAACARCLATDDDRLAAMRVAAHAAALRLAPPVIAAKWLALIREVAAADAASVETPDVAPAPEARG